MSVWLCSVVQGQGCIELFCIAELRDTKLFHLYLYVSTYGSTHVEVLDIDEYLWAKLKKIVPLQLYALSLLVCRLCALCAPSVQRCVAMFCAPTQTD